MDISGVRSGRIHSEQEVDSSAPTTRDTAPPGERNSLTAYQGRHGSPPPGEYGGNRGPGLSFSAGALHGHRNRAANLFELGDLLQQALQLFTVEGASAASGDSARRTVSQSRNQWGNSRAVEARGSYDDGLIRAEGEARASIYADASSQGRMEAGADGLRMSGRAEARIGASAEARGSLDTPLGSVEGHARVSAEAYARAQGYAQVGLNGLQAGGSAEVGARVRAEAGARAELLGGLVRAEANGYAEAGAGASATGRVAATLVPPTAAMRLQGEAFAGARAGFDAKVGVPGASAGVRAEAWAGVGAKFELNAGLDRDGKFRLDFGLGAALGVGGSISYSLELDLKDLGSALGSVAKLAGNIGGGIVGGLLSGVAGLFGGGTGTGAHATQVIQPFISPSGTKSVSAGPIAARGATTAQEPTKTEEVPRADPPERLQQQLTSEIDLRRWTIEQELRKK